MAAYENFRGKWIFWERRAARSKNVESPLPWILNYFKFRSFMVWEKEVFFPGGDAPSCFQGGGASFNPPHKPPCWFQYWVFKIIILCLSEHSLHLNINWQTRLLWTHDPILSITQRSKDIMECYSPHNSVIEEWGGNCSTSDEIVLIFRRFPCQYLHYFTGQNIIQMS